MAHPYSHADYLERVSRSPRHPSILFFFSDFSIVLCLVLPIRRALAEGERTDVTFGIEYTVDKILNDIAIFSPSRKNESIFPLGAHRNS